MTDDEAHPGAEAQHAPAVPATGLAVGRRHGDRAARNSRRGSRLPVERDVDPAAAAVERVPAEPLVLRPNASPAQRPEDGLATEHDPLALHLGAHHAPLPVRDRLARRLLVATEDRQRHRVVAEGREEAPREGMRHRPGQLQAPALDLAGLDHLAMRHRGRRPDDVAAAPGADPVRRPAGKAPRPRALDELVKVIGAALRSGGLDAVVGHVHGLCGSGCKIRAACIPGKGCRAKCERWHVRSLTTVFRYAGPRAFDPDKPKIAVFLRHHCCVAARREGAQNDPVGYHRLRSCGKSDSVAFGPLRRRPKMRWTGGAAVEP